MSLNVNCEILINEVRKRPSLYDTAKKNYHDRVLRKRLWNEVYQKVYSPTVWSALSSQEKFRYGKEVLKRWNSLRHCFRRELISQKNASLGIAPQRKRKYIYFDALLFLLPFTGLEYNVTTARKEEYEKNLERRRYLAELAAQSGSESKIEVEIEELIEDTEDEAVVKLEDPGDVIVVNGVINQEDANQGLVNRPLINQKVVDKGAVNHPVINQGVVYQPVVNQDVVNPPVVNQKSQDIGHDEDELFLRSLVPYMKEFTSDQKLVLRIEIMKSILNYKQSLANTSNSE